MPSSQLVGDLRAGGVRKGAAQVCVHLFHADVAGVDGILD